MIKFIVDNKIINFYNACYNYQKTPWPGDHKYEIKISVSEPILDHYMQLINTKKIDKKFIQTIKTWDNNITSFIQELIFDLNKKEIATFEIKWVFNNIKEIYVEKNCIIIKGICSKYIKENYSHKKYNATS